MIHSEQVQNAVDQQILELAAEGDPPLPGLSGRRLDRDHDVAETESPELNILTIEQREGQHVGRTAGSTETSGDLGDPVVCGEGDRQLLVKEAQGA